MIKDHTENPSVRAVTGLGGGQPRQEHKDEGQCGKYDTDQGDLEALIYSIKSCCAG